MMRFRHGAASVLVILAAAGAGACGDAETGDRRGYTKAPLENPSVVVTPERRTTMDALGQPVLPPVVDPEELGAGGAAGRAPAPSRS